MKAEFKMSMNEFEEAIKKNKVLFGIRQALKCNKKKKKVFVVSDARSETIKLLEEKKIPFEFLKPKLDVAREFEISFESEVFTIT